MLLDTRRHEKKSLNFISTAVGMKISGQFLSRKLSSNKKASRMQLYTRRQEKRQ